VVLEFPVGRSKAVPTVVVPAANPTTLEGTGPREEVEQAVRLAHRWAEALRDGTVRTLGEIARAHDSSVARVSQLLALSRVPVAVLLAKAARLWRPSLRALIRSAKRRGRLGERSLLCF
jgi:hypothetical protein